MIVHEGVHDDPVARFAKAVEDAPIGDLTADVLYGPMLNSRFCDRFLDEWLPLVRPHHALHGSSGTGRITAANPRAGFVGDPEDGLYVHPTIVDGVTIDDELYRTETFGPIVGVATFGTLDEAIALANGHGYGLSSSIYTRDPLSVFRFRERVGAGMVSVNNSTSGAEAHLPFGGNGKSGNGSRQSGVWVLDQFTRWQAMNWDYSGRLQKAQMDAADVTADLSFRAPRTVESARRAVPLHDLGQQVVGQRVGGDPVAAPHRLGRAQSVQDGLLGRLDRRPEQRRSRCRAACRRRPPCPGARPCRRAAVPRFAVEKHRNRSPLECAPAPPARRCRGRRAVRGARTGGGGGGASVARIAMIDPASLGSSNGEGTTSVPISRPAGTPSTIRRERSP